VNSVGLDCRGLSDRIGLEGPWHGWRTWINRPDDDTNGGLPFLAAVTVASVPEPSAFVLGAGGMVLGFWFWCRKRRAIVA
jgi:hypothetical protein